MKLAIIDIVFIVLILILSFRCALRGFIKEVLTMAAAVLGLLGAVLFYKPGAAFVRTKILADVQVLPEIIAFVVLFLIVSVVFKVLESILQDIISQVNLGGLDHFLGLLFGLLEGLLVVCLILFVLNVQPLFNPAMLLGNSIFARFLGPLVGEINLSIFPEA